MTDAIAPAPAAPSAPLSDNELAKLLLVAERECKAAERAREGLRADMLARMEASGLGRLELAGEGLISVVPATSGEILDGEACKAKIEALGARLRDLGQRDVDDVIPKKLSRRCASLRVTPRL